MFDNYLLIISLFVFILLLTDVNQAIVYLLIILGLIAQLVRATDS